MKNRNEKNSVIGVIPARYSSTRLEAKVLADINGKPMIQHVWERAKQSLLLNDLIIACDDERVASAAAEFGAKVVLTAKGHACGTDRIAEVVNPLDVRIVINIQGDEPLIHPTMIDAVASFLIANPDAPMATVMKRIDDLSLVNDPHVVKVVVDSQGRAMYFSRAPIPFKAKNSEAAAPVYYKHIGLYGYTKDFLFVFKNMAVSPLEQVEKLEQLRVLEQGYAIQMIETRFDTVSVDTAQDLEKVKSILKEQAV